MSAAYFWNGSETVVFNVAPSLSNTKKLNLLGCFCVDRFCTYDESIYGVFIENDGWCSRPFNTFPKEFRAWLLINT